MKVKELPRRLWHIFGGLSLPIAGLLAPQQIFLPTLISITVALLIIETIRLRFPRVNRCFMACFHTLLREGESSALTASTYLLVAASIVFILYDRSVAVLALTFVVVGDPVAGVVGERWGRLRLKNKSLEGSCAFLVACLAAGFILAGIIHVALWLVVVGVVFATAAEFLSLSLNDNLTIPLISGGVMMLARLFCL